MLDGLGGALDVIVPRGGKSLVERVQREARVPVFAHLEGLVHIYVDRAADLEEAIRIVVNSKMRRTGVCGAAETLLVDSACAGDPSGAAGRGAARRRLRRARRRATLARRSARHARRREDDWRTEYLDAILSLPRRRRARRRRSPISRPMARITPIASSPRMRAAAERFLKEVDSAIVLHNASTQFADGGEFGFGAEIGIATGRMHARGPVGVEQLCTFKYRVRGDGQVRA